MHPKSNADRRKALPEKTIQKEYGKKTVSPSEKEVQPEGVIQIPLAELHPFPDHPFQVQDDDSMRETAESIKSYGVLIPAIVRPREEDGYEIIAGHCRNTLVNWQSWLQKNYVM